MTAGQRAKLGALVACLAVAALGGSASSAGAQTVLNQAGVNNGGVTQTTWLESFATVGESSSPANTMRISMVVQHPIGQTVTGLRIDDDWNGTDNASGATIKSVTAQQPTISGGYGYSRVTYSYEIPTSGTGMSCGFLSGTRRTDDKVVRVRARTNTGAETATTTSRIKFIAAGNCTGVQDYGSIRSWGANNFNQQIQPGDSLTFTYSCDDPDTDTLGTTTDDECGGMRIRKRNVMTGAVTGTTDDCVDGGDNSTKSSTVNFPDRGRWVVEAMTLEEDCDLSSDSYWFAIGSADVNSASAPSISLNASRPAWNGNTTVTANLGADPDSGDGGVPEYVEWDLDNNGSFETTTLGNTFSGQADTLVTGGGAGAPTKTRNTTGETAGSVHTIRARVTDNGAMSGADNIRRTSSVATTTYTVDNLPVGNAQTVATESDQPKSITLSASDSDGDAISSYAIVDAPDHGQLCTTASGACNAGTGPGRFYRPDGDFAGADTFTFRPTDSQGGPAASTATVTVNVTPQTAISNQPDAISPLSTATFEFGSPVTAPPSASAPSFDCRIDSTLETDFAPCSSPKTYTGLTDGSHTFDVRAKVGGFVDPTPDTYTWTLDSSFPETFIDTTPANPTNSGSASFTFHSDDGTASFECRLDGEPPAGSGWGSCTSPKTYGGLTEGSHTFQVRATDQFNRTDPIPASFTWAVDQTAPTVTIDSAPDDPTNQTTGQFAFSSTDLGATFECSIDGGSFQSCASPASYPGLTDGPHTFAVHATDAASNTGPDSSFEWEIDTGVPETNITAAPSNPDGSAVATFEFDSPDGSAGFECRLDSSQEADWEECSSPQLFADLQDGSHTLEVRATDAAGNKDADPATHTWIVDTSAPQTFIDSSPSNPSGSADAEFEFSADEPGAAFECKLDSGAWEPGCGSPVQQAGLSEGTHVFRVRASDALGNTDPTPATRSWTIDLTAPTASIDSGPADPTSSTSATLDFSAGEEATFECRLDSADEGDFGPCTPAVTIGSLGEGPHKFEVRATDEVGNTGGVAARTWTVDTTPPDVQVDAGMPASTSSTSASFAFSSTDGGAAFQCRLDGGGWQGCTSPRAYAGLDEGPHTFDVRARDAVGNTSAPASDSWTIAGSGPPSTSIDSAPPASTADTTADFGFSSDESSSFQCKLDSAAYSACGSGTASTKSYSGLAVGSHTFSVRATDSDGNTDATPATHTWEVITPPGGGGSAGETAKSPVITAGKGPLKRGKGAAATIACPTGPCQVTRKKAKVKIGGRSYAAAVKIATSLAAGSTSKVKVKLSKAARAALAGAGSGQLTLKLTVSSAGGSVSKKIKLKVKA